jgi:hypothetical protein
MNPLYYLAVGFDFIDLLLLSIAFGALFQLSGAPTWLCIAGGMGGAWAWVRCGAALSMRL